MVASFEAAAVPFSQSGAAGGCPIVIVGCGWHAGRSRRGNVFYHLGFISVTEDAGQPIGQIAQRIGAGGNRRLLRRWCLGYMRRGR